MREILFRGKCTDTGRWYEGQYIHLHKTTYCFKEDYDRNPDNDIHQIVFEKMTDWGLPNRHLRADVLPETVGQYTGLTDKNGKKIFEGDIVKTETDLWHGEDKKERVTRIGKVIYDEKLCQFGLNIKGFSKCFTLRRWKGDFNEVIGNIHDNPQLLKGGAE